MYIKQIIIQGFKSYRDRTIVEPFHPKHNIVVGRNGSGKSNFFLAIQFIISDEYSHLRTEQRQSLLHEGSQPRIITAYVELILDNADGRLPIAKREVHLKRMIGLKKDSYFINKINVPRSDVLNLLEAAGFSRSNPYYIVKQGEINQMATATDSQRLKLLREVAGTRVYDEKTEQSRTLLTEAQGKLEKGAEILKTIEERLQALNEEKEELKEYHRFDKQRRCLEYTVYQREWNDNKRKLLVLEEEYSASVIQQTANEKLVKRARENICIATERCKIAREEMDTEMQELNMLIAEQQRLFQESTKLSLVISDLREEMMVNKETAIRTEAELYDLQQRIDEKVKELEAINPEYERLLKAEDELMHNLTLKEQQRKELYAKQGRSYQFDTKEARDQWIEEQLYQLAEQIKNKEEHYTKMQENLSNDYAKQNILEKKIEVQIRDMEEQKKSIDNNENQYYKNIEEQEEARSMLRELYRQDSTLQTKLSCAKENLFQVEQRLNITVGKGILNGRESLRKVIKTFRENRVTSGEDDDRYYGQVIDNFSCEKAIYPAVEQVGGKRLFHHIVETDGFGTKILKEMNRLKLPGEITFMPLKRLNAKTLNYPTTNDAFPMISKLVYNAKYDEAIRFIFGKTLICRNLEIATQLARSRGVDCITTDGDMVSSKGFLTGGYYNKNKTTLDDYKTRTDIMLKMSDLETQIATVKTEIRLTTETLSFCISTIQRLETTNGKSNNNFEKMEADIRAMKDELNVIRSYHIPNERTLARCISSLDALIATKMGLQRELNEDISSQLSPSDHDLVNTLNEEITSLTKQSKIIFDKRVKAETTKTKLENLLTNNLARRRDELTQTLQKIIGQDSQRRLKFYVIQSNNITAKTNTVRNEVKALTEKFEKTTMTANKSELTELEKWKAVEKDAQEMLEENKRVVWQFMSKKNIYEQKMAEVAQKISQLGVLPNAESYDKYAGMTAKDLLKELTNTNNQLKRYSNVNKKALDQFISFSHQKEILTNRKDEMDRGNEKIEELMMVLEQQKNDAIQFTLKQVTKHFSDVFKRLVPSGHANLVMKTVNGSNSQEEESGPVDSDNILGVGIRVSFTGRSTEMCEMNQLSGGQKSLVALALIFAIQKCDPAPFYLFDEIDQALDDQHREAVASMIQELSSDAQFITTTFKPEMLRHANQFYGVKYGNKVSHIECVPQENAANFLENNANDG